ncbi:putative membrane protein YdjX (TVP38/TMEM64 family) [Paenibacillus cellulosilyticus]|uniref:TVP38/TMEM64 family membrane protein n=1 Tax=Paenibacillus cellulosilyticus TaxID=375489 RepID=A0A2V2Z0F0_9BACL|nr:VTT domain-containing protein [Paenibacillus cellulosilyticus]PWW08748.1 putative membrane protein YdjX (TVP38/TMEM64 family) [Paenibacillus cellulosilyticus]QKS48309.1 TVP38/TMEM64 family protein [Paenibacillus cellulosilyticus]
MNKRKLIVRVVGYIAFLLCLFYLIRSSGYTVADLTPDTIREIAHDDIILIMLIMLVIMTLQNIFTFIPLILVITANITLFGFVKGYLYGCLCSVIGSTIVFLSIRYLFHDVFAGSPKMQQFQEKIEKNGFTYVLFGRILPLMPTNLINITSGLSSIRTLHFVTATTIGNMVYGLVLSSLSFGLISASAHNRVYIIATVIVVLAIVWLYRLNKRRHKKAVEVEMK